MTRQHSPRSRPASPGRSARARSVRVAAVVCTLVVGVARALAAPGDPDGTYATQGVALSAIGDEGVVAMALQADGKLLVATIDDAAADRATLRLTRLTTGGTVDSSFGNAGVASVQVGADTLQVVHAMLRQSADNKLVLAGRAGSRFAVTRLTTAGAIDAGFGSGGTANTTIQGDDEAFALAQQPDSKILAAGRADDGSDSDFAVVRYTTGGQPDSGFSGDGIATVDFGGNDVARAVAVQPLDGAVVLAGASEKSSSDIALARLTSAGTPDGSFGSGGKVTTSVSARDDAAFALLVQPDGKVVVAGEADGDFVVVRYTSTGQPDASFGSGGIARTDVSPGEIDAARALARQADGKLVAGGVSNAGRAGAFTLVRYTTGGQPDSSFGNGGIAVTSAASTFDEELSSLLLQDNGRILAGGLADDGQASYQMVVRYLAGQIAACGNGNVESPEECDDGNAIDTDACPSTCLNSKCGDGFVRSGVEECDDGGTAPGDGCDATCQAEASCGDADLNGSVQASDALRVLRNAVGQAVACPDSLCDVDSSGAIQAGDALRVLRKAVGQAVELNCPG